MQDSPKPAKRSFVGIVNHWFPNEQSAREHPTLAVTEQLIARQDSEDKTWSVSRHVIGRLPGDSPVTGLARNVVPATPGVDMCHTIKSGLSLKAAYDMVRRNEESPARPKGYPVLLQEQPCAGDLPRYWRNLPRAI